MNEQGLRVVIVENHADTLKYLRFYLEQSGHEVISASTLGEAIEILPGADGDVLISDIGLPDGTGWDLLQAVNLPRPIYAIAISGFAMNADAERSKAAGYRHHLVKPVDPDALDRLLDEAARERRA